jgi:hypothetical protein
MSLAQDHHRALNDHHEELEVKTQLASTNNRLWLEIPKDSHKVASRSAHVKSGLKNSPGVVSSSRKSRLGAQTKHTSNLLASYEIVTSGIEAELVNLIEIKGHEAQHLAQRLADSQTGAEGLQKQLHAHSTFFEVLVFELGNAMCEIQGMIQTQVAWKTEEHAEAQRCEQLTFALQEKQAEINKLTQELAASKSSLAEKVAAEKVLSEQMEMLKTSMHDETARLSGEIDQLRAQAEVNQSPDPGFRTFRF